MTEDTDKWRKYIHGVANHRIEDGQGTEQNRTLANWHTWRAGRGIQEYQLRSSDTRQLLCCKCCKRHQTRWMCEHLCHVICRPRTDAEAKGERWSSRARHYNDQGTAIQRQHDHLNCHARRQFTNQLKPQCNSQKAGQIGYGFTFHSTQNRSLRGRSSQPSSWHSTEKTKPNTTEANTRTTHKMPNLNKCTKTKPKPTLIFKNCSCVCVSLCTAVVHSTEQFW